MRIATGTNTMATVHTVTVTHGIADSVRIELPNGTSVCVDLLETPELGVVCSLWVHNADGSIREHVAL